MSLRAKFLAAGASLLVLLVAWPVITHYRAEGKVEAYRRELKAKGEKLEVAELVPLRSAGDFTNSAAWLTAASFLRSSSPSYFNMPPTMKLVTPGKAMVSWQQRVLPTDETSNVWSGLSLEFDNNRQAIEGIQLALRGPILAFDLNYQQGATLLLPHLTKLKGGAQWLSASAVLNLHEGQSKEAWTNLVALSGLVVKYRDEPILISELVRIAIAAIAVAPTWEALQTSECDEPLLREVQTSWESVDFLAQAESAFAMERTIMKRYFAEARDSYNSTMTSTMGSAMASYSAPPASRTVTEEIKEGLRSFVHRYPGYWIWKYWLSYDDELAEAQQIQAMLEAIRQARTEHFSPALKKLEGEIARVKQAHPNEGKWDNSGIAFSLEKSFPRIADIEIQRSLLVTAIALKRYQLKHGTYPTELGSLKPEFLGEVPRDPMDGKPLRYRLNPDGSFLLYSVGEDGVDGGGDTTPSPDASKQWARARDAVWPQPASAEEVKADFDKLKRRR